MCKGNNNYKRVHIRLLNNQKKKKESKVSIKNSWFKFGFNEGVDVSEAFQSDKIQFVKVFLSRQICRPKIKATIKRFKITFWNLKGKAWKKMSIHPTTLFLNRKQKLTEMLFKFKSFQELKFVPSLILFSLIVVTNWMHKSHKY